MQPTFSRLLIASLFGVVAIAPAHALTTSIGGKANPVNDVVFEVTGQNSAASAQEYWCGASDFARRALKAGWRDQIYVVRGRAAAVTTNRRSAVQFTLDPQAAGVTPIDTPLTLEPMKPGDHLSVQRAQQYCNFFTSRF